MENLEKRFLELADRAEQRFYVTFSDFLNMEEESLLSSLHFNIDYRLFGGYDGAERCVAAFGYDCEEAQFPITIIKAEPVSPKFADKLSHRDFLGSLMGLGIKREVLGDIVIADNIGYIFCLNSIAEYIVQELSKVRHTIVKCSVAEALPESAVKKPEEEQMVVASERLDVIVSAVYNFSRSAVKEFFIARKIYVNSRLCENFSYTPKENDIISVRGKGRFVYNGVLGTTKKSRNIISVGVYK
ncbi:MAG: hypothetical protein HDT34_03390 [Clostridiales bacterium]|nr:hypothetical protein [Clostridiales bacterium]